MLLLRPVPIQPLQHSHQLRMLVLQCLPIQRLQYPHDLRILLLQQRRSAHLPLNQLFRASSLRTSHTLAMRHTARA